MSAIALRRTRALRAATRQFSSSPPSSVDVVVCGAGVVGVAAAHYLARRGASVLVVDERPPLSYTSSLSTECYRNFWGEHAAMTAFMNRSVDLLEARAAESGNGFSMNRRGYYFLSATEAGAARHAEVARSAARLGLGSGAVHAGAGHGVAYDGATAAHDASVDGLSVFEGSEAIGAFFGGLPQFVAPEVTSVLRCGRCGWLSAQQMGAQLLDDAREAHGVRTLTPAALTAVHADGGAVSGVDVRTADGSALRVACGAFVNCAGPYAAAVHRLVLAAAGDGGDGEALAALPLENEIHAKAVLRDALGAVPMEAPMMIWEDEIDLGWSDEERADLLSMGGFEASLAKPLPAGAHLRPYPGATGSVLMLWEALHMDVAVAEPPPAEPELRGALFAELMLRGLSRMVPRLSEYLAADGSMQATVSVDGGYYTKTPDNLPLVGAAPGGPRGAYVCAGLSGYGVMAANAAGDLLASHVVDGAPPPAEHGAYADAFRPERWLDADYRARVASGAAEKGLQI